MYVWVGGTKSESVLRMFLQSMYICMCYVSVYVCVYIKYGCMYVSMHVVHMLCVNVHTQIMHMYLYHTCA
jgi:hypothetical protein